MNSITEGAPLITDIPFPAEIAGELATFLLWRAAALPDSELRQVLAEFHSQASRRRRRESLATFLHRVMAQARVFRARVHFRKHCAIGSN